MCGEALVKFHNRSDHATLFILHTLYTTLAIPMAPLPTGALEVVLMVATSFSSRRGLELTCFAFNRPFSSVSALVSSSPRRDHQACSNLRIISIWRGVQPLTMGLRVPKSTL